MEPGLAKPSAGLLGLGWASCRTRRLVGSGRTAVWDRDPAGRALGRKVLGLGSWACQRQSEERLCGEGKGHRADPPGLWSGTCSTPAMREGREPQEIQGPSKTWVARLLSQGSAWSPVPLPLWR